MASSDRSILLFLAVSGCTYDRGPLGLWAISEYTVTRMEIVPDPVNPLFSTAGAEIPGTTATATDAGTWECNLEGIDTLSDEKTAYGYNYTPEARNSAHTAIVMNTSYEPFTGSMLPIRAPAVQIGASCQSTEVPAELSASGEEEWYIPGPLLFERFSCPYLYFVPGETLITAVDEHCTLVAAPPGAPELAGFFYRIELVLESP